MHTDDLHFCSLSVNIRFTAMFIVDEQPNLHPRPKKGEVHRMMISQTGEGKPIKARS